ncbi:MAG TPA: purine-nucleoside phosphorylase [Burkholderiaceae bacterium]|jgi:purine-nucleoside phosphorylase|nr:purine-nucleoside phosphorylase [Burkholderiaceae bacterium]
MTPIDDAVQASLGAIRQRMGPQPPRVAVVLGSGWNGVMDAVSGATDIAYGDLPAFPEVGVAGHAGVLRLGSIGATPVAVLAGRQHTYEDGRADAMKGAIRTLAALGVGMLLLTNAAGSLKPAMGTGSLMLVSDHLNMVQRTPLHGEPGSQRFVDLRDAYDPPLRRIAHAVAARLHQPLHEGVYAWMLGPQFETPAEIRMLRTLGADAVGMSTVPETILARHAGMRVLALSMITNLAAGLDSEPLSHAQTLSAAQAAGQRATQLLAAVVPALA